MITGDAEKIDIKESQSRVINLSNRMMLTVNRQRSINKATLNTNLSHYSDNDLTALERIVECEAEGEDIVGKILIVNVIINRLDNENFPDTIYDIIFEDDQFSPAGTNKYYSIKISDDTIDAVYRAVEQGEDYSKGALYFHNTSIPEWKEHKKLFQHGNHIFYGQ